MLEMLKKRFKWLPDRDNNYYWGLILLKLGIISLVVYLIIDGFEPLSFLITFLICGWGFVLLWKSDNDYRFKLAEAEIESLQEELSYAQLYILPTSRRRRHFKNG